MLTGIVDDRDRTEWPVTHRTRHTTIAHDSLYRVMGVSYQYRLGESSTGTDASSDWRGEAAPSNTNDPGDRTPRAGARSATSTGRTRHPAPADLVGALPEDRVVDLDYTWDWLGNEVERLDDAWSFYERSLGTLTSGNDPDSGGGRPSALYLATNIDGAGGVESTWDGAGWVEVQYGVSGNVSSFTVHGQCHDVSAGSCIDDTTDPIATRVTSLRTSCTCAEEQHYSFRWDELNRLVDGRRYDRNSTTSGAWVHGARLRYRYDAANQRTVKEVLTAPTTGGGGDGGFGAGVGGGGGGWTTSERVTLFVYPGDFERRGLTRGWSSYDAVTTGTDATETQYLVAGARIVWDSEADGLLPPIDRNRRATINVTDLLGTTGAVVDLLSGDLVEVSTYYPNGARENLWTNDALVPIEPMGFTTKEADEEIGVTYFGERWLIPRLGRWATPDPLEIHAAGGGEFGNTYHYVSGSLLQAVDPLGLRANEGDFVWDVQGDWAFGSTVDASGRYTDDPTAPTYGQSVAKPPRELSVYELGLADREASVRAWQAGLASDPLQREVSPQIGACGTGCGSLSVSAQRALQTEEGDVARGSLAGSLSVFQSNVRGFPIEARVEMARSAAGAGAFAAAVGPSSLARGVRGSGMERRPERGGVASQRAAGPAPGRDTPRDRGGEIARVVEMVNPANLRWTQRAAGGNGRAARMRASMALRGYQGAPIDVVRTPDGLVTVDHTRAAVALEMGIESIPVIVHGPGEALPGSMAGRFGSATTWGEAAAFRAARQRPALPPTGTPTPPRLMR